ncbi:unnamed protein product [Nesidiocoris tenuis]|uniref:Uncharacterized protein n=1 Tax=Nesidiocoris tenuis TaxID=355587 RepID=A0A6H5HDQ9_9HEMI|nr:unnamed protein product [Nesidiocoris tenuis]
MGCHHYRLKTQGIGPNSRRAIAASMVRGQDPLLQTPTGSSILVPPHLSSRCLGSEIISIQIERLQNVFHFGDENVNPRDFSAPFGNDPQHPQHLVRRPHDPRHPASSTSQHPRHPSILAIPASSTDPRSLHRNDSDAERFLIGCSRDNGRSKQINDLTSGVILGRKFEFRRFRVRVPRLMETKRGCGLYVQLQRRILYYYTRCYFYNAGFPNCYRSREGTPWRHRCSTHENCLFRKIDGKPFSPLEFGISRFDLRARQNRVSSRIGNVPGLVLRGFLSRPAEIFHSQFSHARRENPSSTSGRVGVSLADDPFLGNGGRRARFSFSFPPS